MASRCGSATKPSFSAEVREKTLANHPVRGGDYTLPTPMMQRTYALVREQVWARRTGTVFYASPRMGKTRCAIAIRDLLRQEFPNVYVTLLSTRPSPRPSTSHMLRLILEAESHVLSRRPDADLLFGNAVADIRVKAARIGAKQYVLLIDEMHLLNDVDLQQLVCFHNQLELQDLRMTAISFAQPEILHRRTSLLANNARQIIARFLSDTLQFDGCASEGDFGSLLRSYDLASEYPEGYHVHAILLSGRVLSRFSSGELSDFDVGSAASCLGEHRCAGSADGAYLLDDRGTAAVVETPGQPGLRPE